MSERTAQEPKRVGPPARPVTTGRVWRDPSAERMRSGSEAPSDSMRLAAEVDRLQAELEAMRQRLRDLEASAERDPLTGVLNRRGFTRELVRAIAYLDRYPATAMLVYLDLDRFKPINDGHGHAAGDAVLEAVAAALTRHVRASDSVARLGGDEFAVLMWNLSEGDVTAKARALEAEIAGATVAWRDATLAVGASAGIAAVRRDDTPASVIARADAAMYARKAGRNDEP